MSDEAELAEGLCLRAFDRGLEGGIKIGQGLHRREAKRAHRRLQPAVSDGLAQLLPAINGSLVRSGVHPDIGNAGKPLLGLVIEIVIADELAAVEEALTHLTDWAFDRALGLGR